MIMVMISRIEARRAEIARRYRKKPRRVVSMAALRVAELNRLFAARYGSTLPNDDAGRDEALLMAYHIVGRAGDPRQRIAAWLELRVPWMSTAEAAELITKVLAKPLRWRADTLAARLNLMDSERHRLRIRTIGAVDVMKAQRKARRLERDRLRKQQRRRNAGAKPRRCYLAAAASRIRPWAALGISRRTWYRRHGTTAAAA
jgi:hypothetical protein